MKRMILIAAGVIALNAPALMAQTNNPAPSVLPAQRAMNPELRQKLMKMSAEERMQYVQQHPELRAQTATPAQIYYQNLGVNPEELKGLPPAEQRAKVREAVAKKAEELNKKKTAGTLTPEEQMMLGRLEMMKNMTNRPARVPHAAEPPALAPAPAPKPTEAKK